MLEKIGKYQIQCKIGEGGMGIVYKAYDPFFERTVAIKTMSPHLCAEGDFRQRFFREARSVNRLNHLHIVAVQDLDEENGVPYLVMEYLDGYDLKTAIGEGMRIPLEQRLQLMMQVCSGLGYAHQNGIIHRDIKPGNIFVTGSGVVKILDFGLAKAVSTSTLTAKSVVLGTPWYMAPEQWVGGDTDHRADIFAAGAVFYELLTYQRAFGGDNYEQILYRILHGAPEPIQKHNPAIPDDLCQIIMRALAKEKGDRYQRMEDLAADLQAFIPRLEQSRQSLQQKAEEAMAALERLLVEQKEILEIDNTAETLGSISRSLAGSTDILPASDVSADTRLPNDYLHLYELCGRAQGEYSRLLNLCDRRLKIVPELHEVDWLEKSGRFEEALHVINEILGIDPGFSRLVRRQRELSELVEKWKREKEETQRAETLFALAASEFETGHLEASQKHLEELLEISPAHSSGLELRDKAKQAIYQRDLIAQKRVDANTSLLNCRQALAGKDLRGAEEILASARSVVSGTPLQSEFLEQIGRLEEQLLALQNQAQSAEKLYREAQTATHAGEEERALALLNELFLIAPEHREGLLLRDEIRTLRQSRQRAEQLFREATSKFLGESPQESIALLDQLLSLQPAHTAALALKKSAQQKLQAQRETGEKLRQVESLLSSARSALSAGDFERARDKVNASRQLLPEYPEIPALLDEIALAEKEWRAKQERRSKIQSLLENTRSLMEGEEDELAMDCLRELLTLDAAHLEARKLLRQLEKKQEARRQALELFQRAKSLYVSNDLKGCTGLLDQLLQLNPQFPGASELRASARQRIQEQIEEEERKSKLEQAFSAAQRALAEEDFRQAREQLEKARAVQGDPHRLAELSSAIDRAEDNQRTQKRKERQIKELLNTAEALDREGEEELAISRIGEILVLDPACFAAIKLKRGIEARRQARAQAAQEKQEKIYSLLKKAKDAEAAGNPVSALEPLRAVLAIQPDHPETRALLARLEEELANRAKEEARRRDQCASLVQQAKEFFAARRFSDADQTIEQLRALGFSSQEILSLHARIRAELENEKARLQTIAEGERAKKAGLELLNERKFAEALKVLRRAAELLGQDPVVHSGIRHAEEEIRAAELREQVNAGIEQATELFAAEKFSAALAKAMQVLQISPGNPQMEKLLIRIDEAETRKRKRTEISFLLEKSERELGNADFDEASRCARQALLIEAEDPQAKALLVKIEQVREAKARTERLAALLVQSRQAINNHDFQAAGMRIHEALTIDPQNIEAQKLRDRINAELDRNTTKQRIDELLAQSELALLQKDFQGASARARDILLLDPQNQEATALIERAKKEQQERRIKEEIASLIERCLKAKKDGDFNAALGLVNEAVRLDPKHLETKHLLKELEREIRTRDRQAAPKRTAPFVAGAVIASITLFLSVAYYIGLWPFPGTGSIAIVSDPPGASISIDGQVVGSTIGGKLLLPRIQAGTHRLTAKKPGFEDLNAEIAVVKGANPDRAFALRPSEAALRIMTNVPEVAVLLDGSEKGKTGKDGAATLSNIPAGRHSLSLLKDGYEEYKQADKEFAPGQAVEIQVTLTPLEIRPDRALLQIASNPPQAAVVLEASDGIMKGITAGGSWAIKDLKPGRVKLSIEKEGYEPQTRTFDLAAGRPTREDFVLTPKPATVKITVKPPVNGAQAKINNTEVGNIPASGILEVKAPPGDRQIIEVLSDGYESRPQIVSLRPGKLENLEFLLTKRATAATMVTLKVASNPPDAEVYLDDRRIGTTPTPLVDVPPGRHKITVRKESYRRKEETIEFRPGEPQPLSYHLDREAGKLEFFVEPAGVSAIINNQTYNLDEQKGMELPAGDYLLVLKREGFASKQIPISISDQKTFTIREKLEKAASATSVIAAPAAEAFSDDFRNADNWENEAGWRADKVLHVRGQGTFLLKDRMYGNFDMKMNLRLINGTSASIIVRAQDRQNYYVLQINGDSYWDTSKKNYVYFYAVKDGKDAELGAMSLPIESKKMREWFELTIEVRDNHFKVKVPGWMLSKTVAQDAELGNFSDPQNSFPRGRIGLRALRTEQWEVAATVIEPR